MTTITERQPKYAAIAGELRQRIQSGELQIGDQLPTFDEMCESYGVTPTTVVRVYGLLEQEELVERLHGRGIFVAKPKRKLTGNIGLIGTEGIRQNADYYNRLMRGIEDAALQNKQHLLFLGTDLDWDKQSCEKVDGILIAGVDQVNTIIQKLPPELPVVAIMVAAGKIPSVTADDYQGAKLAVQYLLTKGHRRIACLMEQDPILPRRRLAGYQDALYEADIKADQNSIRLAPSLRNEELSQSRTQLYIAWGKEQMKKWLNDGWSSTKCTAIFVQNDGAAIGVMQALQEEGIQVPQQVSVIGFDGTQLCDCVSPSLCAVQVPLAQISTKAVEVLNQQIQHGAQDAQSIVFPLQIREGASVAII